LGDASNASAFTKNDSGILKTTVSGAFDQAPRLTLIKAFGANPLDPDDNLQSEDQGDGTTVNVSEQGHSVTYILSVLNTGPTTAEGVQIEDTVPVGMNVNAFDLVAAGNGNTGTRLLRAGFVRVLSKTPSALGLVPHAELGADHTLRIAGLRVKPGDYLVVSYTIDVSSEGIDAPAPGTMIHQFRASVSAENLPDNDGSLSFGDDLELKINGLAQVAEPQYEPGGIIPFVTHDLAASKAALNAIFGRKADAPVIVAGTHPHALPLVPGSNPPRFVPGFYRYDVKYQNLGTGAATAVQLTVPLPANTTLYRTAFVTKLASGVKQIDLSHAGNSFSVINGVPTFAFSKINAHTTGYVRMEVIVGVGAIDFNGSLVDLPFPYIQGNAAPRVAAKAEVPGRTTANATAPPPPIPFRANGLLARLAAYDASLIPPSLGIWKIVPQYVRKDELFTIQLIVMNAGAFDEDALYVRMKIPPHTAFVSADAGYTGAAEIVNAAGEHYVSLPLGGNNEAMPNGHARPVRAHEAGALTVTLRATEPGTFVENTAYMQSSYREPVYAQPATVTILGPDDPNPQPKALSSFITGLQVVNLPHQSSNVVPLGGGYVVAQGGGNVVSQGGGNVVSQGGGNIVAQGGGNIVVFGASSSISINPGAGVISVSSLLQPGMLSSLLKSQAINLLLPQAANLIGQDGGTLIGNDGGTLVGGGFSSLLANTRALIVAQGGGNIISHDGGSIISHDGGSVVAQGGGNVVSQGGGNIIVVGGASVVSQGGGNLIALPNSIGLIGQDGGTLVGAASAGVVSQGGGN
ncbi:MAG TPA: hypothetical protein VGO11_13200, partial [Chthoniobacteraceae bacterium]|nr:hypothetical protein [Chthoniobacteraceae bacterium]